MKRVLIFVVLILIIYQLFAPSYVLAETYIPTADKCSPEIVPPVGGLAKGVDCPFCDSLTKNVFVHLKWDLNGSFKEPICSASCYRGVDAAQSCDGFVRKDEDGLATLSAPRGLADYNLKPKDDIFVPNSRSGNTYNIFCCDKCNKQAGDKCDLFCKEGTAINSVPVNIMSSGCYGGPSLDITNPGEGQSVNFGQTIYFRWKINNPNCAKDYFRLTFTKKDDNGNFIPTGVSIDIPGAGATAYAWRSNITSVADYYAIISSRPNNNCYGLAEDSVKFKAVTTTSKNNSVWLANVWSAWQGVSNFLN